MTDAMTAMADPTIANSALPALAIKSGPNVDVDKTARDFEAMFATQMLQPMFEGVGADSTFGGGHGEEVMKSFLLQEYGKIFAKGDRLGIAAQVKKEMLRIQESANGRSGGLSSRNAKQAYANAASADSSSAGGTHVSVQ